MIKIKHNTIALIVFTLVITTACHKPSECDPETYVPSCVDGKATSCIERMYYDDPGYEIDRIPCGLFNDRPSAFSFGPKCLVLTSPTTNKSIAMCSFDERQGEHCPETYADVCVDGLFYRCNLGVREYRHQEGSIEDNDPERCRQKAQR